MALREALSIGVAFVVSATVYPATLEITFPPAGMVINGGTLVIADLQPKEPEAKLSDLRFLYSRDGVRYAEINGVAPQGTGDFIGGQHFATLWNVHDLEGGRYYLRAKVMRGKHQVTGNAVEVWVNEMPRAAATAEVIAERNGEVVIRFDGSHSTDSDGTVTRHEWDFEDGGTASGAIVEHAFQSPGTRAMMLDVQDNQNGRSAGHYLLTIERGDGGGPPLISSFIDKISCGCAKMEVRTAGKIDAGLIFFEPADGIPAAEQSDLGPYGKPGEKLKLPRPVKNRFEIKAILKKWSKPQLCSEGQRGQITINDPLYDPWIGPVSSDARYDPTQSADDPYDASDDPTEVERKECPTVSFPNTGPWCDDDYHGGGGPDGKGSDGKQPPSFYKEYFKQERISWIDAAGAKNLRHLKLPFLYIATFEAVVSGESGTCKCNWDILIEVDRDATVVHNQVMNVKCIP